MNLIYIKYFIWDLISTILLKICGNNFLNLTLIYLIIKIINDLSYKINFNF